MRIIGRYLAICCALCLLLAPSVRGQDTERDVDLLVIEAIDIYDTAAGDFLDVNIEELDKMAWEAYQEGDYERAAEYYLTYLRHDITDGGNIYNLACCYGLLGEAELAAQYLERSVHAGFDDIDHIMGDPDFDNVRGTDVFDSTVEGITSMVEEKEAELGEIIYAMSPAFFECRVQLPENYNPEESYTLVLGLHGLGSNPERFITLRERFAEHDFIFASPRGPYPFSVGNEVGYSWNTSHPEKEELLGLSTEATEEYIARLAVGLKEKYNIDKVYLLGFSQGCAMTYMAGIHHHELFEGIICFGGWLDTEWISDEEIAAANELRVFIAHGTMDRVVEPEAGIEARDILVEHGYDVTFYEFEGEHRVPEEALQVAEAWMKR